MNTQTLYLIRGLPGAGKTTLAHRIAPLVYSADDYFGTGALYCYDATKIKEAHEWCQEKVRAAIKSGLDIAVANTFTRRWEMQPYFDIIDTCFSDSELAARCIHGVPAAKIAEMRARWEQ